MSNYEVEGSATISWSYPDIYEGKDHLFIELLHVRASDGIRIHYESDRDGWVIEQGSTGDMDSPDYPDWQEVAFVKSWARWKDDS